MAPDLKSLIRRHEEEAVTLLLRSQPTVAFHYMDVHRLLSEAGVTFGGTRPRNTVYARLKALKDRGRLHQPDPGDGRFKWGRKGEEEE
ncbi:MAG: hypothetical protein OXQ94_04385 [Gemmatimonadota bacterium]|nr:hypothetical protein [Gemmatimonadota bacterium]MDE2870911.1 hypothetical protein [Gemmatimonadota bacterium]